MAVPVIESTTTSNGTGSVDKPSGTTTGDLLIAWVTRDGAGSGSLTMPAGWTQIGTTTHLGDMSAGIAYKVATASEPTTYSFQISSVQYLTISMYRISGFDPENPIDDSRITTHTTQSFNSGTFTTTQDDVLLITFATADHTANMSAPSGTTQSAEVSSGVHYSDSAYFSQLTPGTTTARTWTAGGTPHQNIGALLAIPSQLVVVYEQEGYRWRNDDGSESSATWKAAQDTVPSSIGKETPVRLRILTATSDNPSNVALKLQYRRVGETDSHWRDV